ncbi:hypothetical protein LCGC14_1026930 [marine sediment metagenome]|uniref:Uncharacterized protein n=1 Tax=marine sediment metagenome TaxID=412755 RepID=A0A0F9QDX3_9ZZZZ
MAIISKSGGLKMYSDNNAKLLILLILLLLGFIVILQFRSLDINNSISETVEDGYYNLVVAPEPPDGNFTEQHFALATNQSLIMNELQELNFLGDCIIDSNSIRNGELPIDNQGGFRRVSLITLICPEVLK